jgi:RNA polymerase sigma-70 factor (ECF subfamily)
MNTPSFDEAEALAARARTLLREARRRTARSEAGAPRQRLVAEAMRLVDRALGARDVGVQTLRAAIESLHAQARDAAAADWHRIAALYDLLAEIDPTPAVAQERALAHARRNAAAGRHEGSACAS